MRWTKRMVLSAAAALIACQAMAAEPLTGAALRNEAIEISKLLRCPASVNLTLYESEAAIASELKAQIYLKLQQGQSRDEIIDFIVQRYGEQMRYKPPLTAGTALLWGAPWLLFVGGAFIVARRYRARQSKK